MDAKEAGRAVALFVFALGLYWGTASYFGATATPNVAYFNQLAAAFLDGRAYLVAPPSTHDLTLHQGQWYVSFPPLPALLMLPWVWWAGLPAVNTVLFCAFFGALNVALVFLILAALHARRWSRLRAGDQLWLTALFGVGSVHWYMATLGSVWFVAQITTVTFVALTVWLAIRLPVGAGSALAAGAALGLAMLARPNVALTWPLLLGVAAMQLSRQAAQGDATSSHAVASLCRLAWQRWLAWAAASAAPLIFAVGALLWYNWARFNNPLDFGYLTANVAERLAGGLQTYGQFHVHFAPKNFWAMWLAGPLWNAELNFWAPDPEGMSLLLTTPALIYLVRARGRNPLTAGAWLAFALLLAPLLLYYNTGWWQFGYRFSLDFMLPVMVLLALAAGDRVSHPMRGLIVIGVLVNLYGVLWWHM